MDAAATNKRKERPQLYTGDVRAGKRVKPYASSEGRRPCAPSSPPCAKAGPNKKHPVHWYFDGNIFVQIEGVRYRLHKGILARQSEWFRKTPGPSTPVDNLPLYHLDGMGFNSHDFEVLLNALEDAITYVHKKPPFTDLASILRVSIALSFPKFENFASKCLETMWSSDLSKLTEEPFPYATKCVILARRYRLTWLLKRAMYELVRLEGFGQPRPTATVTATANPSSSDPVAPAPSLDARDLSALIHAREQLTHAWNAAADPDELPKCARAADAPQFVACTAASPTGSLEAHAKLVKASGLFRKYRYDPVRGLEALRFSSWATEGFCEACVKRMKLACFEEQRRVWEELDGWFGLETK